MQGTYKYNQIPVFVYGTLLSGFGNNRILEHGCAELQGEGFTKNRYQFYSNGSFPYVVQPNERGTDWQGQRPKIIGELWLVDDDTFAQLDRLEGHPHHYTRERVPVIVAGVEREAWIYISNGSPYRQLQEVRDGDFRRSQQDYHRSLRVAYGGGTGV